MTTSFGLRSIPLGISTAAWRVRNANTGLRLELAPIGAEPGFKSQPETTEATDYVPLLVPTAWAAFPPWVLSPFTRTSPSASRILALPSRGADAVFRRTAMLVPPIEVFEDFTRDYFAITDYFAFNPEYGSAGEDFGIALIRSIRHKVVNFEALIEAVARICHTLTDLAERDRVELSPYEIQIRDIAWRLSDAIHGKRVHYAPRFVRWDGSTD